MKIQTNAEKYFTENYLGLLLNIFPNPNESKLALILMKFDSAAKSYFFRAPIIFDIILHSFVGNEIYKRFNVYNKIVLKSSKIIKEEKEECEEKKECEVVDIVKRL